jgi:hypothetical protein
MTFVSQKKTPKKTFSPKKDDFLFLKKKNPKKNDDRVCDREWATQKIPKKSRGELRSSFRS